MIISLFYRGSFWGTQNQDPCSRAGSLAKVGLWSKSLVMKRSQLRFLISNSFDWLARHLCWKPWSPVPSSSSVQPKSTTFTPGGFQDPRKGLNRLLWSQSWPCLGQGLGLEISQVYLPPKLSTVLWELFWVPRMAVEAAPAPGCGGDRAGWVLRERDELIPKAFYLKCSCPSTDRHSPGQGNLGWFSNTGLYLPSVSIYWSVKDW